MYTIFYIGKKVRQFYISEEERVDEICLVHNIFWSIYWGQAYMHIVIFPHKYMRDVNEQVSQRECSFLYTWHDQSGYILNIFFIVAFWYTCNFVTYAFMQKVCPLICYVLTMVQHNPIINMFVLFSNATSAQCILLCFYGKWCIWKRYVHELLYI